MNAADFRIGYLAKLNIFELLELQQEINRRVADKENEKKIRVWRVIVDDEVLGFFSTCQKATAYIAARAAKADVPCGTIFIKEFRVIESDLPGYEIDSEE